MSHAELTNLVAKLKRYSEDFPGSPAQEAAEAIRQLWDVIQGVQTDKAMRNQRNPQAPRKRVRQPVSKHDTPILDRIMRAVDKDSATGCWNWLGSGSEKYGYIAYNKKSWGVHRLMYVITHNVTLKKGDVVMHECDNTWCCNPSHLVLGTHASNMIDMTTKGRNGFSKLTLEQAKEIRIRFSKGETCSALAAEFSMSFTAVHHIASGKAWKVLSDDPEIKALAPRRRHSRWSQLTEDDVRAIKGLLADGVPQGEIANRFSIDTSSVSHIHTGRRWKHVT